MTHMGFTREAHRGEIPGPLNCIKVCPAHPQAHACFVTHTVCFIDLGKLISRPWSKSVKKTVSEGGHSNNT